MIDQPNRKLTEILMIASVDVGYDEDSAVTSTA